MRAYKGVYSNPVDSTTHRKTYRNPRPTLTEDEEDHHETPVMEEKPIQNGNGHIGNGHVGNGHLDNGHVGNGHLDNGHLGNGHLDNGHVGNGHLDNGHLDNGHLDEAAYGLTVEIQPAKPHQRVYGYLDLFSGPNMARKTCICLFTWITVVLIYYAISLNPSVVGGDFYQAFILGSLVEMPAVLFLLLTLNLIGRKMLQAAGFAISGVALIAIAALPSAQVTAIMFLVNVAKLAVTAAFCLIYLHTSEIFPTVIRSIALGLTVTFSRLGGIISPFASMYLSSDAHRNITLYIFGVMAVTAAMLTMLLPETTNKILPETLEDGEAFGKPIKIIEIVRKPVDSPTMEKLALNNGESKA